MSTASSIRAFIGIKVPDDVALVLRDTCNTLTQTNSLRCTPASNLHLTLVFLGSIEASTLPLLAEELAAITVPTLDLRFSGIEFFERAGALVLALHATSQLVALQRKVELACTKIGHVPEARLYRPHITLARYPRGSTSQSSWKLAVEQALNTAKLISFIPDAITLYESRAGRYNTLAQFPIRN